MIKEQSNIILVESEVDNETLEAESMTELNGDWLRALRAQRDNNQSEILRMESSQITSIENND